MSKPRSPHTMCSRGLAAGFRPSVRLCAVSLLLRDIQSNRQMASALNKLEGGDGCTSCELSSLDLPALRCRSCKMCCP